MKNKIYLSLFIMILMQIPLSICGCGEKDYSNYKNEDGYAEYVSYADKGCKYAEYYDIPESIAENERALKYYKNNVRQCGDFLITNYLDGICVNDYVGESVYDDIPKIVIPETLEGRPVIAIGSKIIDKSLISEDWPDDWGGEYWPAFYNADIVMPATIKYIGEYTTICSCSFTVDKDNPYYASENGSLYTKDMKTVLFYCGGYGSGAEISEKAEIFAPANGLFGSWGDTIEIDKNIKTIDTKYSHDDSEEYMKYPFTIKGYKGTVAERWAKDNDIKFEAIKD